MSVEIGESTKVGAIKEFAEGGWISGPGWASIANMYADAQPTKHSHPMHADSAPWASGGPIEYHVPDSLCGNCRRDRHDYPLTETVAEMWKSLSFDENYDPETDESRIVCPGSDVCGPIVDTTTRMTPGYYATTESWVISADYMKKYWESAKFDTQSLKVALWTADYAPISLESDGESPIWTFSTVNELKGGFQLTEYTYPDASTVTAGDLYAFAPVDQAAVEAAPKQIEHEAPQSAGFDFTNIKTAYPTYPTGKKKKK